MEPEKTQWISFTKSTPQSRRSSNDLQELADRIAITNNSRNIAPVRKLRWLGLIFDEYFRWDHHRSHRLSLAYWRLNQIKRLMRRRGLGVKVARRMVQAVCTPTLFYGFECIFQGPDAWGQKQLVKEWDGFLRKCGRVATGLLTSTRLGPLYKEAGIPQSPAVVLKAARKV